MRFPRALFRRQSLRVRLTLSFVSAAVALTLALSSATFFTVRTVLERNRLTSASRQTMFALLFAREFLRANPDQPDVLASSLRTRENFEAMVASRDDWFSTALSLTPSAIPQGLRSLVRQERLGYEYADMRDVRMLVFGAPLPPPDTNLYLFYSLEDIDQTIALVARVLAIAGLVVIAVAVALAQRVSGRILRPLAGVSAAAQSVAEGLLETRVESSSRDEVGTLAGSFNQMAGALQEMIQRERRFVAAVSHELRTPVAALHATAEILTERRSELPPSAREAADLIMEDVSSLRRLIDELMEVSELDSRRAPVRWERVNVSSVARAVLRRRRLDIRADGPEVVTFADKARLERILGNLVDNAIEHGGGMAGVSIRLDDGQCAVEVSDNGPGIAPEDFPYLFERFYKADRSRSRDRGGIGLGLVIAMQNAHLLGGTIDASSVSGKGSRFTLRLPLREAAPERENE
ncbi:MAG: HAMP domain-containing histidine kinase [Actinomycetota bacterium]|nr:HAMP domain-containing histidine kinase [Actinomycetota bacterium]